MRAPEEDVELQPGEVEGEERHQREDELGQDGPRDLAAGVSYLYNVYNGGGLKGVIRNNSLFIEKIFVDVV